MINITSKQAMSTEAFPKILCSPKVFESQWPTGKASLIIFPPRITIINMGSTKKMPPITNERVDFFSMDITGKIGLNNPKIE